MARRRMTEEVRRANQLVDWLIEDTERAIRQERRLEKKRQAATAAKPRRPGRSPPAS